MRNRHLGADSFIILKFSQVISIGFIEASKVGNVIPETVKFGGTLRSMSSEGLSYLMERIKEVSKLLSIVQD